MSWLVPFGAGVVAAVFAAKVWGQWSARRRPHQLAWAVGLTMYAAATFLDALVTYEGGWSVASYRAFFALAAANVGFLGLGTILLARPRWIGAAFAVFVVAATAVAALGQLAVPLEPDTPIEGRPLAAWGSELGAGAIPFSSPARWAFLLLNVVGGAALIGGALLSWRQTREMGVLLIGLGALLPFLGGSLSTLVAWDVRVPLQLAGIVVMFLGYLRSRETPSTHATRAPVDG